MHRRDMLRGAGSIMTTFAMGRTAFAQAKTQLKASDVHPPGYPTVVAVENLGKKLEQATNGRLGVQMYASMQLGGEKEAIEQAQVGAIQLARASVGAIGIKGEILGHQQLRAAGISETHPGQAAGWGGSAQHAHSCTVAGTRGAAQTGRPPNRR